MPSIKGRKMIHTEHLKGNAILVSRVFLTGSVMFAEIFLFYTAEFMVTWSCRLDKEINENFKNVESNHDSY